MAVILGEKGTARLHSRSKFYLAHPVSLPGHHAHRTPPGVAHELSYPRTCSGPWSRGITVNTVQPGPVETDMNPATGPFAESLKRLMAIPRYGQGTEIAALVAYLASPEASFVTGAAVTIDGGFAT
jgi:hypothetical protein